MPGEIISSLNLKRPALLARENLPKHANSKTLCLIISYSGNTKETIKLYNQAKKKKCQILIITSGGKLSKTKNNTVLIEKGYLPREALFIMLEPIFKILKIPFKDLSEKTKKQVEKKAKKLAKKIKNKHPIIYVSSEKLKAVAYRWEDQFSENAKIFSEVNFFPELAHNDIESIPEKNHKIIFLINKQTKQIKKAAKMLKPIKIKLKGKNFLEKMFYGIYLGDYTSKYLAKLKHRDYKKIPQINKLKKK